MKVKPRGKIYSINEGYTNSWAEPVKQYVASKKEVKTNSNYYLVIITIINAMISYDRFEW